MDRDRIVTALAPLAERTPGLRLLLLVGSHARGDAHDRSDIDLAVLADEDVDLAAFIGQATMALGTDDVDVADLSRANGLYRFEAASVGIRIAGDADLHEAFRYAAVLFWCDAGPVIREAYADALAGLG